MRALHDVRVTLCSGVDVNYAAKDNGQLFHIACTVGHAHIVRYLLQETDVDPNATFRQHPPKTKNCRSKAVEAFFNPKSVKRTGDYNISVQNKLHWYGVHIIN